MKRHFAVRNLVVPLGIALSSVLSSVTLPAQAVQVRGTTYFTSPPRLVGASTTQNYVYAWSATYYFTLDVLENAGEPLQRVTIAQNEGIDRVRFNLKETEAFDGDRRSNTKLGLGEVTQDDKTKAITVNFNPPVPPGKRVTIALSPYQNPAYGGVYLFGVTAFPQGEPSYGQFLGFGRISIYESNNSVFFRPFFRH
ncbi:MAG: DUF2808 domain-containing protein [Plectolyngbya sp. WJT66-NPBG17]|jgi:hypothetical protein|nr:DUF2808 domain-containing protein [Plectolyngbya sp. WJT66-NPBG17]MBW4524653.1 DUF2808 domain-containing protein [Phormidium tanganyikae FI6-MK23]